MAFIDDVIDVADDAYPDGRCGDGMAEFIAREIEGTYEGSSDPAEDIWNAIYAMNRARAELDNVIGNLKRACHIFEEDYEHVIHGYVERGSATRGIDKILLKRIKNKDLPLFVNYQWHEDVKQDFLNKLKGD